MYQSNELSLEQQFNLRSFKSQVSNMTLDQAQGFLVELYEQMMVRDQLYKKVIKHQWGKPRTKAMSWALLFFCRENP
jgi:Phycobilisome degradation protein nblA